MIDRRRNLNSAPRSASPTKSTPMESPRSSAANTDALIARNIITDGCTTSRSLVLTVMLSGRPGKQRKES